MKEEWRTNFIKLLTEYRHNCKVIKQINSDKALYQRKVNAGLTFSTIFASIVLTLLGFMSRTAFLQLFHGKVELVTKSGKIISSLYKPTPYDNLVIEMIFNISVLVVLVLSVTYLIFRPLERSFEHHKSVVVLAHFMRDIDDYLLYSSTNTEEECKLMLPEIRARYKIILDVMPAHTDKDFRRAKKNISEKDANIENK
jgi:hypothetical protein